jgi:DNA-binding transcriptional regulator YhcF (GntR family)
MEKILDLGAKKSDAQFAEKKGMFDLTQAERDRVIKEKLDAAKQLNLSEDETRKLIEQGIQKELDRKHELKKTGISAANRDDLLGRALLIKKDNPTISIEEAIKRAAVATYAGQTGVAEGKIDNEKEKRIAAIRKDYGTTMKFFKPDSPIYKQQLALMEKAIAEERGLPPEQGINALPGAAASGKVPPPSGYKRD